MSSKNSPLRSQFQLILEKRLKQIQDKLNKTCCQYDSLMPLLQIVDFIPHIMQHQKQLKGIQKKIKNCEERLKQKDSQNQLNKQRSQNMQKEIQQRQDNINSLKKQILELQLNIKQKKDQTHLGLGQQSEFIIDYDSYLQKFQKHIQLILAQYKTQMDIQFSKCQKIPLSQCKLQKFQQNISEQFRFLDQLLQRIDNQIQLTKGQLQLFNQDLLKFHQFNYHRIQYEIIATSQALDSIKLKYENFKQLKNNRQVSIKDDQQISEIIQSIEKFKWQIIGSKKYYLRQISKLYYIGKNNYQTNKIQVKISKQFEQVETLFKELSFKLSQFLNLLL